MLINVIRENMNKALKENDTEGRRIYSLILDALEKKAKDKRADLTETEEGEVILRMIKMADETLKLTPADKVEIIRQVELEKTIYAIYAPAQMTAPQISLAIESVLEALGISESATMKNKGMVMKGLMPLVKGKADGKLVNELVETRLNF